MSEPTPIWDIVMRIAEDPSAVSHCMSMKTELPLQAMWDVATTSHHADTITHHRNTSVTTRRNAGKMNGKLIC